MSNVVTDTMLFTILFAQCQLHLTSGLTGMTKFLIDVKLLDEYKSDSLPVNHVSLCFQLVFQSNEKTLENQNKIHIH